LVLTLCAKVLTLISAEFKYVSENPELEQMAKTQDSPPTLSEYLSRAKNAIAQAYPDTEKVIAEALKITVHDNGNTYIELAEYSGSGVKRVLVEKVNAKVLRSRQHILSSFARDSGEVLTVGMKVLIEIRTSYSWGINVEIVGIDHKYTIGDMAALVQEIQQELMTLGIYEGYCA
jgi:hypothetical protein